MTFVDSQTSMTNPDGTGTTNRPVMAVGGDGPGLAKRLCAEIGKVGTFEVVRLGSSIDDNSASALRSVGERLEEALVASQAANHSRGDGEPWPWVAVVALSGKPPSPVEVTEFRALVGRMALAFAPAMRLNAILLDPSRSAPPPKTTAADILRTAESMLVMPAALGQLLCLQSRSLD